MDLALITHNGWYATKPNQTKPKKDHFVNVITQCLHIVDNFYKDKNLQF